MRAGEFAASGHLVHTLGCRALRFVEFSLDGSRELLTLLGFINQTPTSDLNS